MMGTDFYCGLLIGVAFGFAIATALTLYRSERRIRVLIDEMLASPDAPAPSGADGGEGEATEFVDWYLNRQNVVRVEGASAVKAAIQLFLQERGPQ